jgi:hypothetical protein
MAIAFDLALPAAVACAAQSWLDGRWRHGIVACMSMRLHLFRHRG